MRASTNPFVCMHAQDADEDMEAAEILRALMQAGQQDVGDEGDIGGGGDDGGGWSPEYSCVAMYLQSDDPSVRTGFAKFGKLAECLYFGLWCV